MKKTTFTLLLSLLCCRLAAQCPTGDITFSTQGQIDSFQINYPGCTDIPGNLKILGDDISSLDALIGLANIGGDLQIGQLLPGGAGNSNFFLENLSGLDSLHTIGGGLKIFNNPALTDLSGLKNLQSIGGYLLLYRNNALPSLSGLNRLQSIGNYLILEENNALSAIDGLDSLQSIGGGVSVINNTSLIHLNALEMLSSVGGSFLIDGNNSLKAIDGLNNLQTISIDFVLKNNSSLISIDGLENIDSIGGSLDISLNHRLVSLSGLEQLRSIGINLTLTLNDSLWSLNGLEGLRSVPALLLLDHNNVLSDLNGLSGLENIGFLEIVGNPNLAVCNIPPICAHLENGPIASIISNAPGCNSPAEVEAACILSIEETSGGEPVVLFSFNSADDFLQIQVNDPEKWDISLFDLQGRQMFRHRVSGNQIIEVKDWPSGVYAARAVSGKRAYAGRFVKE